MKRTDRWVAALVTPALCLGFAADSRAELINRGTYDGVRLIYDSVQRITLLGDPNWAQTSGFDLNGEMTWDEARAWAGGLTIGGFSDWRLPITFDETCRGADCTNSEMGHLFAVEGVSSTSPGLFRNVQERQYWSSRSYSSEPDLAWYVHFGNGDQAVTAKSDSHIPWAVRDGDVGAEVSIDTKPGSSLVRVNLGSHGSTPVTVLGSVLLNEDIAGRPLMKYAPSRIWAVAAWAGKRLVRVASNGGLGGVGCPRAGSGHTEPLCAYNEAFRDSRYRFRSGTGAATPRYGGSDDAFTHWPFGPDRGLCSASRGAGRGADRVEARLL